MFAYVVVAVLSSAHFDGGAIPAVDSPVPETVVKRFKLDPFYKKHIDCGGMPIVASEKVSDAALREAHWIVNQMLEGRGDILRALGANNVRLAVMSYQEFTTDIPEHRTLKPAVYWDRRARGLGATEQRPAVSCAEENVLCYPGDPYWNENICIHEFAHAIHGMGLRTTDPTFDKRLRAAYAAATKAGLWKGTYAGTNHSEYWAEATQSWFDDNRENDSLHNHVNTRTELKEYDGAVAKLCAEVYGDRPWRYKKPALRPPEGRAHLAGYEPGKGPKFEWRKAPLVDKPVISIQTSIGNIEVELDAVKAPKTTANFLDYANAGLYADGTFHRTVTASNQPGSPVKIAVIQAAANPAKKAEFRPGIPLERTKDTGIKHVDGAISMARDGPDTAQDEFFICVGDQPELDFGGKRNPDGQGFAAFGKVTKGMDIVRKIHEMKAKDQTLDPPLKIQRAIRMR